MGKSRVPLPPARMIPFMRIVPAFPSGFDQAKAMARIDSGAEGFPPGAVVHVPVHGLLESAVERLGSRPAELAFDLVRVDGVAAVMSGTVRHERDQSAPGLRRRHQRVENVADLLNHLQ